MLKSTRTCISFLTESILHSYPMNKRLYMRLKHYRLKHVKGDEAKLDTDPESVNKRVTIAANISSHCAFIKNAQNKLIKNAKRKFTMKKAPDNYTINASSSVGLPVNRDCNSVSNSVVENNCKMYFSNDVFETEYVHSSKRNKFLRSDSGESTAVHTSLREWERIDKNSKEIYYSNGIPIKILSYNVLAQCLLNSHPYLYRKCSPDVLKWEYRSNLLYKEICNLDPDIFCLQEVQESHLDNFYNKFEKLGYRGIYKKRTGIRQDGCAIYFKSSLFELLDHSNVEFYQPELPLLNRDNIGLMVKLAPNSMKNIPFVVATTHLLYNPRRTDVRLAQMQVFLAEIDRFSYFGVSSDKTRAVYLPTIMTGDLNSAPLSPVHSLVASGQVGSCNRDSLWMRIAVTDQCQHLGIYLSRKSGQHATDLNLSKLYNSELNEMNVYSNMLGAEMTSPSDLHMNSNHLFNSGTLEHKLYFKSVYNHIKDNKEMEVTTFQDFWLTVDYMFYSTKNVQGELLLLERLKLPTANECHILQYLPNEIYGSDHLALMAKFLLTPS